VITDLSDGLARARAVLGAPAILSRHLPLLVSVDDPALLAAAALPARDADSLYRRTVAREFIERRDETLSTLSRAGFVALSLTPEKLAPELLTSYLRQKARASCDRGCAPGADFGDPERVLLRISNCGTGRTVAEVAFAFWPGGVARCRRVGLHGAPRGLRLGAFLLESAGVVVARAEKPSASTPDAAGPAGRCGWRGAPRPSPARPLSGKMAVDLPGDLPLHVRCSSLARRVLWKRDAESDGGPSVVRSLNAQPPRYTDGGPPRRPARAGEGKANNKKVDIYLSVPFNLPPDGIYPKGPSLSASPASSAAW
jgi:hypothetical protein